MEIRPYESEHSARIKKPDQYDSFARKNNEFGKGIHVIYGIKEEKDISEVQAIRFDAKKFTVKEAKAWLKEHDWKYIKFEPAKTKEELNNFFGNLVKNKRIYLTLDIDAIDPCFAPGTSTPEPFGLSHLETLEILRFFAPNLIGFDIVEVCPPYDNGETSLLAAKYIRYLLEYISNK